jgi:hypothetical protein
VGPAKAEALLGQLPGLVPPAGPEGVEAEQHHRVDGGRDGAALPAVADHLPEGFAAAGQPVHVVRGDADPHDPHRIGLLRQACDGVVERAERGDRRVRRIGEGARQQVQDGGWPRRERRVEGFPQFGSPAERAHQEQGVQRLEERRVLGFRRRVRGVDRGHQQAVGGIDVTVAVEQSVRGRHRRGQRFADFRVGPAGVIEQARHVLQVIGHVRAEICRLGHPPAPVRAMRSQLGGPQQGGDGADRVAAAQRPPRRLLEQPGNLLVGSRRGLGEVPRAAFGLVRQLAREGLVGGAPLVARRQFHDRPSTSALGRSSHWTSSTSSSSGLVSAACPSSASIASDTTRRSGTGPSPKPSATLSASRSDLSSRPRSSIRGRRS